MDWGSGYRPEGMKPSKFAATSDIPLESRTTYGEAFAKNKDLYDYKKEPKKNYNE